jgi:hypothetical protein
LFNGFLLGFSLPLRHTGPLKDTLAFTGRFETGFGIVLIGNLST